MIDEIQKRIDYAIENAGALGLTNRGYIDTKKVCLWLLSSGDYVSVKELRANIEKRINDKVRELDEVVANEFRGFMNSVVQARIKAEIEEDKEILSQLSQEVKEK